jgi:hypothetical protein
MLQVLRVTHWLTQSRNGVANPPADPFWGVVSPSERHELVVTLCTSNWANGGQLRSLTHVARPHFLISALHRQRWDGPDPIRTYVYIFHDTSSSIPTNLRLGFLSHCL